MQKTTAFALFLFSLLTFVALTPQDPQNAQVVSRFALTVSIVERGSIDIEPFAPYTIDKSAFRGRHYTDKAPGLSLLAVPAALLAQHLFGAIGDNPDPGSARFRRHVALVTALSNGLVSSVAVAMLFLAAMRLGATHHGALYGAVALAGGTPFLGWSTAFFAHSISASLLAVAFGWIALAFAGSRPRPAAAALLGFLLGYTISVDITAAPLVAVAGLCALAACRGLNAASRTTVAAALVGAGLLGLAPLLIYNQLAFASPFRLGYSSVIGFEGMKQGFFGITWPDPGVALALLFGLYRGLLPLSPVLILAPLGLWRMWRRPALRPAAMLVVFAFASYLCINAGYHYWNGGWSTGPRHLTPALPFLALTLAFAWPNRRPGGTLAVLALSVAVSLICAATSMFSPDYIAMPFIDHLLPSLVRPGVPVRIAAVLAIWAAALILWRRTWRRTAAPETI